MLTFFQLTCFSMEFSMFKVAGVSSLKGEVKVRFANDMTRVKVLSKNGHTDIELMELPEAMDKPAVVTYLKGTDLYKNPAFQAAIDAADAKYNGAKVVKVTKAKKAAPSIEAIKARAGAKEAVAE
jgi:transcriptional regulator of aromatic amino acid metabolism